MKSSLEHIKKVLAPPGNGVHTVHTAQEIKDNYFNSVYGSSDSKTVQQKWDEALNKMDQSTKPLLIGIPSDTGGGIQRGANWGPLFIREQTIIYIKMSLILEM
jgi:agmatinase